MVFLSQTRIVNYRDLCSKGLINDLKEAATCEVRRVCRLACNRCPYVVENIDISNINVKGLSSYTIKLEKAEDEQLLVYITAPGLDQWLIKNKLPFITRKAMIRVKKLKWSTKTRNKFVSRRRERSKKLIHKSF
ncbi:MAG: hypothetical protein OQK77_11370 [Psychromonas sp.]|nr:hypothetical protein [Psychromonas sp.]